MLNKKKLNCTPLDFIYRFFGNKEYTGLRIDELNTLNKEEVNFPRFGVNLLPFYSLFFFRFLYRLKKVKHQKRRMSVR